MKTNNKITRIAAGALAAMSIATAISIPTFAAAPETVSTQPTAVVAAATSNIDEENGAKLVAESASCRAYVYPDGVSGYIEIDHYSNDDIYIPFINFVMLQDIIHFNDGGYVKIINDERRHGNCNIYDYVITVKGCGPKGLFSGAGHMRFTDESGDTYDLDLWSSTYKEHKVKYNSDHPHIVRIDWWS